MKHNIYEKVEKFISTVRDSFVGSQRVYTNGSCYHFYLILKQVFEDAEPGKPIIITPHPASRSLSNVQILTINKIIEEYRS